MFSKNPGLLQVEILTTPYTTVVIFKLECRDQEQRKHKKEQKRTGSKGNGAIYRRKLNEYLLFLIFEKVIKIHGVSIKR